jgi:hypothetical protein
VDRDTEDAVLGSLERMAGSRRLALSVKQSLERLTDGSAAPELAELARDVLAGRVELSSLRTSNVYADPLQQALTGFQQWYSHLSPADRDRFLTEARRQIGTD